MRKIYLATILTVAFCLNGKAQTNVSGGIYSNTTWSLSGSPYIVTDTVVVFPGVTLTIQPGVTVKFANNKGIEVRRATLVAIGNSSDSITFTSIAATPTAGIWTEINLNLNGGSNHNTKFSYCNFSYATNGINLSYNGPADSVFITNCNFSNNINGLYPAACCFINHCNFTNNGYGINGMYSSVMVNHSVFLNNQTGIDMLGRGVIKNSTFKYNQYGIDDFDYYDVIDSCIISNNQYGVYSFANSYCTLKNSNIDSNSVVGVTMDESNNDSLFHCKITYNVVGMNVRGGVQNPPNVIADNTILNNSIGFKFAALNGSNDTIYCNRICNNTTYDFYNTSSYNINIPHNYWCTSDSAATEAVIYDGYDNINLGLVKFMPIDSLCLANYTTAIKKYDLNNEITIYPNPAKNNLQVLLAGSTANNTLVITDMLGNTVKQVSGIRYQ